MLFLVILMNSLTGFCLASLLMCYACSINEQHSKKNVYLKIADETLALGNSEAALNFYNKAIEKNGISLEALIGKIEAYIQMNKLDTAMHEINNSLKKYPNNENLKYSLGKIFLLRGKTNEAMNIFLELKSYYKALNAIGTIYESRFDHEQARKYYIKAINANPQYADACGNLGLSLVMSTDKIKEGIEYLERACTMPGASSTHKYNLALAYGINKNYDKALSIYEEEMNHAAAIEKVESLKKIKNKEDFKKSIQKMNSKKGTKRKFKRTKDNKNILRTI